MSASVPVWAISQKPASMLIAAAMGGASPSGEWIRVGVVVVAALLAALIAFVISARRRS
jgi:hypothetical protein